MAGPTPVVLVADQHLIRCGVPTDGKRLLDVLNDKTTEFLRLLEPQLSPMTDPQMRVAAFARGLVPKPNISLALIIEEKHEAPQKRANMMVRKNTFEVYVTVPGYEVRGFVHSERALEPLDFQARLVREGQVFFPITEVTLTPVGPLGEPFRAPAAMVNRNRLGLFFLADKEAAV